MCHDALVEFGQRGAGLAEAPVVFRALAEMRDFAGGQGAQARLAVVGPGNHSGGVEGFFVGGTVTGRFAAAGLKVVDGAFDELAQGEQDVDLMLVIAE